MDVRHLAGIACGVILGLGATGCGTDGPPVEDGSYQAEFIANVHLKLENDMSEAQREVLQKAARGEDITFEDMERLTGDVLDCFDAAGVEYTVYPPHELAPDVFMPSYVFYQPEGDYGLLAQADWCIDHYKFHASMAYQSQPSTVEAMDREFERRTPEMIECLREAGEDIDDDATRAEVQAATDAMPMCDYRAWI